MSGEFSKDDKNKQSKQGNQAGKDGKKQPDKVREQVEGYQEFERFEIIEGIRYDFLASPTAVHQILVTRLSHFFSSTCQPNGLVIVSPMDVYLDEDNLFQPDVIFIANENLHIVKKGRIEGVPDLVVEILSRGTGKNDKIRKKNQYARFGVQEYWVVDPEHFIIDQLMLDNSKYRLHATYAIGDTITSELFSCVSIDMQLLFDRLEQLNLQ